MLHVKQKLNSTDCRGKRKSYQSLNFLQIVLPKCNFGKQALQTASVKTSKANELSHTLLNSEQASKETDAIYMTIHMPNPHNYRNAISVNGTE